MGDFLLSAQTAGGLALKIIMIAVFFGAMIAIGLYCRRKATDVNGFVLGGRSVGPWLTAFAYGTSYFSAVIFVGYAGQFGWKFGLASTWIGLGNAFIGSLLAWVVLGTLGGCGIIAYILAAIIIPMDPAGYTDRT